MGALWYQAAIVVLVYVSLAPGSFWVKQLGERLRAPSLLRRGAD
jgi:hypothetical protein